MKAARLHLIQAFTSFPSIPLFLCPILALPKKQSLLPSKIPHPNYHGRYRGFQIRSLHTESALDPRDESKALISASNVLPLSCPGCGAFTQTISPQDAGFYTLTRKPVRVFLTKSKRSNEGRSLQEDETYSSVVEKGDSSVLKELGLNDVVGAEYDNLMHNQKVSTPLCDRCHGLLHHCAGTPIIHPTLQSIQDIMAESPHKYNHIYHILDAADFPLSLVPQLQSYLSLPPQRSQNRRAKTGGKFYHGRKAEMSFIITRSDLLAPRKEQVDALMPYLVEVLRDALGSSGKDVRLGNVRCVSSKRGWWTKTLKEDIWDRGGAGWMVGKVNVGKSNLFENIFPKGRNEEISSEGLRHNAPQGSSGDTIHIADSKSGRLIGNTDVDADQTNIEDNLEDSDLDLPISSMLPPPQIETAFPVMPVISSLPGTTASPIRLPFGGGKGELIDLPGLSRGNLDDHVRDEHKQDLVMEHRVTPEQQVIKPGQSLLLGGLVRITPTAPDIIVLAYPFAPLQAHVTSTEKAIAINTQQQPSIVPTIIKPGVGEIMASAGVFDLKWDVTKQRAGPLTSPMAGKLKVNVLPFVVLSADILIEGCGWVELVVQVRKRHFDHGGAESMPYPAVEIFSPNGKHVGARKPMNGWLLGRPKPVPVHKRRMRPKRSMKGEKKRQKLEKRAAERESPIVAWQK